MTKQWTDLDTWMHDNADERLFRVWKYKKMFTPLEQDKKYFDQSVYEDEFAKFYWIDEVVEFDNGRIMFGFRDAEHMAMYEHGELDNPAPIVYMMDGEFTMEHYEGDIKRMMDELGYYDEDEDEREDGADTTALETDVIEKAQKMAADNPNSTIVYNGEIFN